MHSSGRGNAKSKIQPEEKPVVYHPEALNELIESAQYYESCSSGLGHRFLDSVENALNVICGNPLLFCADEAGRRRCVIRKFPYLIIYKVKEDCIFILAAAHGKRKPGYWKSRDT